MLKIGQVFKTLEKVETLTGDTEWMILSYVSPKKTKPYYKIMLAKSKMYRPIAMILEEDMNKAIDDGKVKLLKVKKIKLK